MERNEVLAEYEFAVLPSMIFSDEIPILMILQDFPKVSEIYLNQYSEFKENEFSSQIYSFIHEEGEPYYVTVLRFPFSEDVSCIGLMKYVYIVGSSKLSDVYIFADVLRNTEGKFYYETYQIVCENNSIHYNLISTKDAVSEMESARDCSIWAVYSDKR